MLSASQSIRKNRLRDVAAIVEILVLGNWLGTMTGFAFLFAPTAFHHIGNRLEFAALIGAVIRRIDALGAILGGLALILSMFDQAPRRRISRQLCIIAMLVGTGIEHFSIVPTMERALAAVPGNLASLAPNDPVRAAYDQLHHISSTVYGAVVLLGIAALLLAAQGTRGVVEDARAADPR